MYDPSYAHKFRCGIKWLKSGLPENYKIPMKGLQNWVSRENNLDSKFVKLPVQTDRKFSLSKKSSESWFFSLICGKISMGDEKCWNVESWIAA